MARGARRPILWGAQVIPTPAVNPIPTSLGQRRPRREKGLVSETRGPRGCLARVSSTRAPCRSPRGSHRPITPGVPGVPTAAANFKMSRSSTPSFRRSRASRHAFLSLEPLRPCLSLPPCLREPAPGLVANAPSAIVCLGLSRPNPAPRLRGSARPSRGPSADAHG